MVGDSEKEPTDEDVEELDEEVVTAPKKRATRSKPKGRVNDDGITLPQRLNINLVHRF